MLRALTTAATGMIAQQNYLDVIANNVSNVNTTAFKKSRIEFQDLLSQAQRLNAEDINILNALGKLNLKRKDYEMAEQNYQAVLAKNGEDYRALTGMALVYEKQRKLLDSQMLFEKLENFDNENDDIVLQHSRVLLKLNELENIKERIKKVQAETEEIYINNER